MARILIVDDRPKALKHLASAAARVVGADVVTANSAREALQRISEEAFDVVITDLHMETSEAGLDVLKAAKERDIYTQVIVITAYGTPKIAVEAMRVAAFDFLEKNAPGDVLEILEKKIALALEFRNAKLKESGLL